MPFDIGSLQVHQYFNVQIDSPEDSAQDHSPSFPQSLEDYSSAFEAAARAIESPTGEESGQGAPFGSQTGNLKVWAHEHGKLIPGDYFQDLSVVSDSTSEHKVFFRESDLRAVKKTWAGVYGQVPFPNSGKLDRKNATPAEYLRRMALQIEVFGSDLRLEGVTVSDEVSMVIGQPPGQPSFVISQGWLTKCGVARNEDISAYLAEEGFAEAQGSYFGWYRFADGVVIVDAKPDNFIRTVAGLVPIDLQMALFDATQMRQAGLTVRKC